MKAYVLKNIADFSFEEVPDPALDGGRLYGLNEESSVSDDDCVIVKVKAAGICGSDIPRIYKNGAYHHPLIPGHEFAGEIVETGKNVPGTLEGKRVGVFPLIPCHECAPCKKREYEMCANYNYLGSRCDGGFAEYVKVPADNLINLPDEVTFEQAAMLEPLSVAYHAIKKSGLGSGTPSANPDPWIVVCGLGTIGLFVIMHLKSMGYSNILCIGNKDSQKEHLSELGIGSGSYADFNKDDIPAFVNEKTAGCGADVFFECVGKNESVSLGLNVLGPSGRLQLVGNPASDMNLSREEYWKILRKQFTVTGTWNSSFTHSEDDDWNIVLRSIASGKIKPEKLITHRFSPEDFYKGFEIMRDKTEDYIKVMCIM